MRFQHRLFRKEALDRLSTPERLDRAVQIVEPKDWVAVAALAGLLGLGLLWSILGTVPTAVTAAGVLTHPRRVVQIQAPASGYISALTVEPGRQLQSGDTVVIIDQPQVGKVLEQEQVAVAQRAAQDEALTALERRHLKLRSAELDLEELTLSHQHASRAASLEDAEALGVILAQRVEAQRRLRAQGLLAAISDGLLEAEQEVVLNQARLVELRMQLRQLELQRAQIQGLRERLTYEAMAASTLRRNELQELRSKAAVLHQQLNRDSRVVTPHAGRVLELAVNVGQLVSAGDRVASLEVEDPDTELVALGYFSIRDGRRIAPGMRVQVTPDMVERERFGGLLGVVTAVSPFPITPQGAASLVGNRELAETLTAAGALIEVLVRLDADPGTPTGYRWSSAGSPDLRLTPGTTASVRVTVEGRAPITYVLPFLREWSGIY